jgi:hypothetical protein
LWQCYALSYGCYHLLCPGCELYSLCLMYAVRPATL